MESGNIIEYIDRQKIICAVVLEIKKQRLRLLTENNREVKLSAGRLSHKSESYLDLSMGRDRLVETLKETVSRRRELSQQVDIRELWEVLNTEQEWIDLPTMTEFCFPDDLSGDHESAVIRAFFSDRVYFKFNHDQFFPNTEERVEQITAQARETERKNRMTEEGGNWLKYILNHDRPQLNGDHAKFTEILKSFYLFEKESPHYEIGKAMLAKAGLRSGDMVFQALVKLDVWDQDENLDLYQYGIPIAFSDKIMARAGELVNGFKSGTSGVSELSAANFGAERRDLTDLPLMTIDGQLTLDFDDALSVEDRGDHYCVGVHITDVGHFIKRQDAIDQEAIVRASSVYMPDQKIPMLPASLAEDLCSLRAGELRPAISTLIQLTPLGEIIDYEILPSVIRIRDQLSYHDVNMMAEEDKNIRILHDIAKRFREKRLGDGAVQISLPEINIWVDEAGKLIVNRTNRESVGRILVSELMIMANWLTAKFLTSHRLPAIYRSQPNPKDRLYKENEGSLFQNWMQRKLLSRFVLSYESERHSGLGVDAYVTGTSPIRKYSDLVTQRQLRAVFEMEQPYTSAEVEQVIQVLEQPMRSVSRLQNRRKRYWLLKYLEGKIGEKEEAIVLGRRRNSYLALIPEYMIECDLPVSGGLSLKPEDLVQITIQHVNARKDTLSVFVG